MEGWYGACCTAHVRSRLGCTSDELVCTHPRCTRNQESDSTVVSQSSASASYCHFRCGRFPCTVMRGGVLLAASIAAMQLNPEVVSVVYLLAFTLVAPDYNERVLTAAHPGVCDRSGMGRGGRISLAQNLRNFIPQAASVTIPCRQGAHLTSHTFLIWQ